MIFIIHRKVSNKIITTKIILMYYGLLYDPQFYSLKSGKFSLQIGNLVYKLANLVYKFKIGKSLQIVF